MTTDLERQKCTIKRYSESLGRDIISMPSAVRRFCFLPMTDGPLPAPCLDMCSILFFASSAILASNSVLVGRIVRVPTVQMLISGTMSSILGTTFLWERCKTPQPVYHSMCPPSRGRLRISLVQGVTRETSYTVPLEPQLLLISPTESHLHRMVEPQHLYLLNTGSQQVRISDPEVGSILPWPRPEPEGLLLQ